MARSEFIGSPILVYRVIYRVTSKIPEKIQGHGFGLWGHASWRLVLNRICRDLVLELPLATEACEVDGQDQELRLRWWYENATREVFAKKASDRVPNRWLLEL